MNLEPYVKKAAEQLHKDLLIAFALNARVRITHVTLSNTEHQLIVDMPGVQSHICPTQRDAVALIVRIFLLDNQVKIERMPYGFTMKEIRPRSPLLTFSTAKIAKNCVLAIDSRVHVLHRCIWPPVAA